MDNLHEKVLSALKNCVGEPKCRDCPWEECEGAHEHVELPRGLLNAAIELLKAQRWVSVKDGMPDAQGEYLVVQQAPKREVTMAWFSGENGWLALDESFYADGIVTHFMPLPEPPKEG